MYFLHTLSSYAHSHTLAMSDAPTLSTFNDTIQKSYNEMYAVQRTTFVSRIAACVRENRYTIKNDLEITVNLTLENVFDVKCCDDFELFYTVGSDGLIQISVTFDDETDVITKACHAEFEKLKVDFLDTLTGPPVRSSEHVWYIPIQPKIPGRVFTKWCKEFELDWSSPEYRTYHIDVSKFVNSIPM